MIALSDEVREALASRRPVVALESTIFSPFGLPAPANAEALRACISAVRDGGGVPAVTAVLDGVVRAGLDEQEHDRILNGGVKVARRDLALAVARAEAVGVTTVSASVTIAAAVGIDVFATGGIGGVHRGVEHSGDVSADLEALAAEPVVTVSAGAKAFLDLARTLEYLETASVPVLGWRTDDFPMFWCRTSGLPVPARVEDEATVARLVRAQRDLALRSGVLVAVPVPEKAAIPHELVEDAIAGADAAGVRGPAVTPHVLQAIANATQGRTVAANIALARNNAVVATKIAQALLNEFTR